MTYEDWCLVSANIHVQEYPLSVSSWFWRKNEFILILKLTPNTYGQIVSEQSFEEVLLKIAISNL